MIHKQNYILKNKIVFDDKKFQILKSNQFVFLRNCCQDDDFAILPL